MSSISSENSRFNKIQTDWIVVAIELDNRTNGTYQDNLHRLITDNINKFIQIARESEKADLTQYNFNIQSVEDPKKPLHNALFRLASELEILKSSQGITQTLIDKLNKSISNCFVL